MVMVIAGNGSISGITTGGLSANCVDSNAINAGAVTQPKIGSTMYAGYGPAFNAYQSSGHNVTNTTWTKIQLQTENFDTANCFDNTTNYRFTPNVAGYYLISGCLLFGTTTNARMSIYKNGAGVASGGCAGVSGLNAQGSTSVILYLNGSTDYVELYGYQATGGTVSTSPGADVTVFSGVLMRAA